MISPLSESMVRVPLGKYERAYLWAYYPHGSVLPVACSASSRMYLALPTIGSDVGIGGTGMVDKGGCAFKVDASTASACRAFAPTIGGSGIATLINTGSRITSVC